MLVDMSENGKKYPDGDAVELSVEIGERALGPLMAAAAWQAKKEASLAKRRATIARKKAEKEAAGKSAAEKAENDAAEEGGSAE